MASPAEHELSGKRASELWHMRLVAPHMWDLPVPGIEPVSPALQGGFLTTRPPGMPSFYFLDVATRTFKTAQDLCYMCIS